MDQLQLEAIAKVIKTLNYYQILKLTPLSSDEEIREAFHREALLFHPDQFAAVSNETSKKLAKEIYTKVVEAYRVLSSPEKRSTYDNKLKGIDKIDDADEEDENAITSVKHRPSWASSGPGEKFFKLAEKAFGSGDVRSAFMNIQIAVGTEPSNPRFVKLKEKILEQMEKSKKSSPNP